MEPKDQGRRVAPRVNARLKVKFKNSKSFINEYTHNISKGGIFIRTAKPCALRDQLEIVLVMPKTNEEIAVLGEVIHVVTEDKASEKMPAGMGLQILELKKEDQEKIENFIKDSLNTEADVLSQQEHMRIDTRIRVKFESKEALVEEYIHNISHGGIFIQTLKPKVVGKHISVILIHPDTSQEILLHGEVERVVSAEDAKRMNIQPGMSIKFKELDSYLKHQIDEFIKAEAPRSAGKGPIIEEE